jgi:hypothetical protein
MLHSEHLSSNRRTNIGKLLHLLSILLIPSLLASCQVNVSQFSETVVSQSARKLRDSTKSVGKASPDEDAFLLGDSVAVFFLTLVDGLPDEMARNLSSHLNKRIEEMPFYRSIKKTDEIAPIFKKDNALKQANDIYLDTLARVSVSNKDITNRIGHKLGVQNFIVFQVDRWPCPDCKKTLRIRIKVRVVDVASGLIIWNGTNEINVEKAADATYEQLFTISEELIDRFHTRFKRKWHKVRFHNLGLLAKK